MDVPQNKRQAIEYCPASTLDDDALVRRMLRLYEDLEGLAGEVDPDDRICLQIVQSPEKLHVYGKGSTPDVTPLLAAVLRASLEQRIAIEAQVRAKLAPAWEALSKQR